MRIAIVQLSDVHIRNSNDAVLGRAIRIAAAAKSVAPNPDAFFLGIIGDVAFSGTVDQYKLAHEFFNAIKVELLSAGKPVHIFLVPGNHDLDFTLEPDTRPILLQSIRDKVHEIDRKGEMVRQILSTQEHFFEFESKLLGSDIRSMPQRLVNLQAFEVNGKTIDIRCYNTAWVSTNPEKPGQLVFPVDTVVTPPSTAALAISVFHHPYNWLDPENARLFRHQIETSSDVVLTGHEHETSVYVKLDSGGVATQYIEGSVLQESGTGRSAFNVILLDNTQGTYEAFTCEWNGELYSPSGSRTNQFIRNKLLCTSVFRNSDSFFNLLNDPGLPILHPHKRDVKLDDLYIYPSLTRKNPDKSFEMLSIIESPAVLEHVRATPYLLIAGDDTIGKTSFCKKLYRDLHSTGDLIPILLSGDDFEGITESAIHKTVRHAIMDQYDEHSIERYFQLDRAQRVVIIDDWHRVKYASKGRASIIGHLRALFGKIIFLTNRLYAFDELAEPGPVKTAFADFELYEIREFGQRLTGRLIEMWHSLGREYSVDAKEFHYAVASSEHKIAAVIGSGVLPTYPIFLIGLLQVDTSPNSATQNAGSYGHILESLITSRMADVSKRSTDIGTMYTYVSRIAYSMFKLDRRILSSKEVSELHNQYCMAYKMNLSELRVVADLVEAKILVKDGDSLDLGIKDVIVILSLDICRRTWVQENPLFGPNLMKLPIN
jgi:predicted MPP superfamily phosphohydrolase